MPVYAVQLRINRLQQDINAIDGGPGGGLLNLGTAGMGLTLATITLLKPCATISAAAILTFSGLPLTTLGIGQGTVAAANLTDSNGTVWISGLTAGTVGTDIIISQTTINIGDIVAFTSGTIIGN